MLKTLRTLSRKEISMSEWCQNKSCPSKKNQNQIRGSKGNKYYQSNKASGYYKYWCSMGCREHLVETTYRYLYECSWFY